MSCNESSHSHLPPPLYFPNRQINTFDVVSLPLLALEPLSLLELFLLLLLLLLLSLLLLLRLLSLSLLLLLLLSLLEYLRGDLDLLLGLDERVLGERERFDLEDGEYERLLDFLVGDNGPLCVVGDNGGVEDRFVEELELRVGDRGGDIGLLLGGALDELAEGDFDLADIELAEGDFDLADIELAEGDFDLADIELAEGDFDFVDVALSVSDVDD